MASATIADVTEKLTENNKQAAATLKISVRALEQRQAQKKVNDESRAKLEELKASIESAGGVAEKSSQYNKLLLEQEKRQNDLIKASNDTIAEVPKKIAEARAEQEAMRKSLEDQGKIATDNKKYNQLAYNTTKEELKQRYADATSPSAKKEIRAEQKANADKEGNLLKKIAGGIGGIAGFMKDASKKGARKFGDILKGTLFAGVMIALLVFVNSKYWDKFINILTKAAKFVTKKLVPFFTDLGSFIINPSWKKAGNLFKEHKGALAVLLGLIALKTFGVSGMITGITAASKAMKSAWGSKAVQSAFSNPKIAKMMGPLAIAGGIALMVKDGMAAMKMSTEWGTSKTSAAMGGILGGMDEGFKGAMKNMGKWALIGAGIGSIVPVIGTLVGGLIGAVIGAILGWIGGEKIAKFFESVGKWFSKKWTEITTWIKEIPTKLKDWVVEKFTFNKALVIEGWTDLKTYAGKVFGDVKEWFTKLFSWASSENVVEGWANLKTYVGEVWGKVKEWFTKLFSWASSENVEDSWLTATVKNVVKGVKEWLGDLFKFDSTSDIIKSAFNVLFFLPNIILKGLKLVTGWLLSLFGFDEKAKKLANAEDWSIGGLIITVVESIAKWFGKLFDIDFTSIIKSIMPGGKVGRWLTRKLFGDGKDVVEGENADGPVVSDKAMKKSNKEAKISQKSAEKEADLYAVDFAQIDKKKNEEASKKIKKLEKSISIGGYIGFGAKQRKEDDETKLRMQKTTLAKRQGLASSGGSEYGNVPDLLVQNQNVTQEELNKIVDEINQKELNQIVDWIDQGLSDEDIAKKLEMQLEAPAKSTLDFKPPTSTRVDTMTQAKQAQNAEKSAGAGTTVVAPNTNNISANKTTNHYSFDNKTFNPNSVPTMLTNAL